MELTQEQITILYFLKSRHISTDRSMTIQSLLTSIKYEDRKGFLQSLVGLIEHGYARETNSLIFLTQTGINFVLERENSMQATLSPEENKDARTRFLNELYAMVGADTQNPVDMYQIGLKIGLSTYQTKITAEYLRNEGYIDFFALGGRIVITHQGIKKYEELASDVNRPDPEFSSLNIIHIHQMTGSQIIQGSNHSTQTITNNGQISDLAALKGEVAELKTMLSKIQFKEAEHSELSAEIATIEAQLISPKPKVPILRESFRSMRNICEGAIGSLIASDILIKIDHILKGLFST